MATYSPKDHYYVSKHKTGKYSTPQVGDLCRGWMANRLYRCIAIGEMLAHPYDPTKPTMAPAAQFESLGDFLHSEEVFRPVTHPRKTWVPIEGTSRFCRQRQPVVPHAVKGMPGWPQ